MVTQQKRRTIILLSIPLLLLIPLIGMQLTDEVKWSIGDFLVMGGMLLGTALVGELIYRKVQKSQHRMLLLCFLLLGFILLWAELAVGIFGTPFAGS